MQSYLWRPQSALQISICDLSAYVRGLGMEYICSSTPYRKVGLKDPCPWRRMALCSVILSVGRTQVALHISICHPLATGIIRRT
jgi:hypothetical protein